MQSISIFIRLLFILLITTFGFIISMLLRYLLPYRNRAYIVRIWAHCLLKAAGAKIIVEGSKLPNYVNGNHIIISNHISWLDSIALYSQYFVNFVSRSQTRRMPIVGQIVSMGGAIFIDQQNKRDILKVNNIIGQRLIQGACVGIYPEGKTSTGRKILTFKSSVLEPAMIAKSIILPIVLEYYTKQGKVAHCVSYAGKITLWQTVSRSLALNGFIIKIKLLPPVAAAEFANRDELTCYLHHEISKSYLDK